ncbi:MAG TPA: ABC transporter ATP-binding protein [Thermodesulfobacteriota bacterium]|nr:ABC transporter ATP-binding protein [Thermodesulfobacteriota bacterium]
MLKLSNLSTLIGGFQAVREISLEIPQGDFVTLLGSNGAGKTTLFRTIAGVLKPFQGTIEFKGRQIQGMPAHRVVKLGLCLCPEGRLLFPQLSVLKNLTMGAYPRRKDRQGVQKSLEQVYALFPILRDRKQQLAGTFSGGEQQMLAIARALMSRPELLLLDEPSMGLAPLVVRKIIGEVVKAIHEAGTTIFLSEQNARMALMIARRGYVLETGRIVLEGSNSELMSDEKVKKAYIGA